MEKEKLEQKLTFDDQVIEKLQGSQQTKFPGSFRLMETCLVNLPIS